MRKSFILFISALFLLAGLSAFAADGEFMADFRQSSSGQEGQNGKIYFKGGSSRMEFVRDGRTSEIMILNLKNKKAWMLNTEDKTFMEINFQDKPWQPAGADKSGKVTETKLGRETVSGYLCDKTRYTYQDDPASETMVWMSPKLGYPVKWEHTGAEGKTAFQLSKIREGKMQDSLFAVPGGYRNFAEAWESETGAERTGSGAAKVVEDDVKDLAGDAKGAAKDEVSNVVTDSIREGIRGLFR